VGFGFSRVQAGRARAPAKMSVMAWALNRVIMILSMGSLALIGIPPMNVPRLGLVYDGVGTVASL
jgi:hypothetical protein